MAMAELSMALSTKNHSLLKARALLCFQITAGMMATGKKERCMDMENLVGMMDLLIKVSINTVANMAKALSYSHQKSTIKVNGCMESKMAKGLYTTNKGI